MRKNIKDAAVIALWLILFKLAFKLIPSTGITHFFEDRILLGIGVIFMSYIILFLVVLLILTVKRKNKSKQRVLNVRENY